MYRNCTVGTKKKIYNNFVVWLVILDLMYCIRKIKFKPFFNLIDSNTSTVV